jgi:hypothetical protein
MVSEEPSLELNPEDAEKHNVEMAKRSAFNTGCRSKDEGALFSETTARGLQSPTLLLFLRGEHRFGED